MPPIHPPTSTTTYTGPASSLDSFLHSTLHTTNFFDIPPTHLSSTLDTPIHPIFHFPRWPNISPTLYTKIGPALQLSSLWLIDDRVIDWFLHDTVGVVRYTSTSTSLPSPHDKYVPYLATSSEFEKDARDRDIVKQIWFEKLTQLSKILTIDLYAGTDALRMYGQSFHFSQQYKNWKKDHASYTSPTSSSRMRRRSGLHREKDGTYTYTGQEKMSPSILVSNIFLTYLSRVPTDFSTLPPSHRKELMNCHFFLAVVLVHEVAHTVSAFPRYQCPRFDARLRCFPEVFHSLDEVRADYMPRLNRGHPDSGMSWELSLFGEPAGPSARAAGHRPPSDHRLYRKVGATPFMTLDSPVWTARGEFGRKVGWVRDGDIAVRFRSMQGVANWFQKEHWAVGRRREDVLREGGKMYWLLVRKEGMEEAWQMARNRLVRATITVENVERPKGLRIQHL